VLHLELSRELSREKGSLQGERISPKRDGKTGWRAFANAKNLSIWKTRPPLVHSGVRTLLRDHATPPDASVVDLLTEFAGRRAATRRAHLRSTLRAPSFRPSRRDGSGSRNSDILEFCRGASKTTPVIGRLRIKRNVESQLLKYRH